MHLKDDACAQFLQLLVLVRGDHGHLDDIGSGALNDRVHGLPACFAGLHVVAGVQLRQQSAASGKGGHETVLFGILDDTLVVFFEGSEFLEIAFGEFLGFGLLDLEFAGQFLHAHAVDQTEVDGLGVATLVVLHFLSGFVHDQGRGTGVDVFIVAERIEKFRVLGEVGEYAQFDLGIIGGSQQIPLGGREAGAHARPVLSTDGNILQVGLGA